MNTVDFDIGISTEGKALTGIAGDFSSEASDLGLVVATEERPSGSVRASLEWVMPTAVALFLANKYLGTLLEEAAKDHYPLLKAALLRLARRTTGKDREVILRVVTSSSAKVLDAEQATLSIWVSLRDTRRVVFRLDHALPPQALVSAIDQLFELVIAHGRDFEGRDFLSRAPSLMSQSSWAPIVMRFAVDDHRWRAWLIDHQGNTVPWDEGVS